jgi:hypothetical protein
MDDAASDYNVCPSCGTEFGVNDVNASIPELREAWIQSGPRWWSRTDAVPANWNPFIQLAQLGAFGAVMSTGGVVHVQSTASPETNLNPTIGSGWAQQAWARFADKQCEEVCSSSSAR